MKSGDFIETGREGGGVKGLAGFSQTASKVLEAYLSSDGFSLRTLGSKPQAGLSIPEH